MQTALSVRRLELMGNDSFAVLLYYTMQRARSLLSHRTFLGDTEDWHRSGKAVSTKTPLESIVGHTMQDCGGYEW